MTIMACSSFGTETGNPSKHSEPCRPAEIVFDVSSSDGLELAGVTVDGDTAPCVAESAGVRCTLFNTKDGRGVDYAWTIAAEGHEPKTIQFSADWAQGKCADNVVEVQLDATASQ